MLVKDSEVAQRSQHERPKMEMVLFTSTIQWTRSTSSPSAHVVISNPIPHYNKVWILPEISDSRSRAGTLQGISMTLFLLRSQKAFEDNVMSKGPRSPYESVPTEQNCDNLRN